MKMAKASQADMDMAIKLCSALEAVDRQFFPEGAEGDDDPEDFDPDDDEHCARVLRHIRGILEGGSIGRVIWGMYVLLDPANKVVDPDASTLEPHPEFEAAEADAERYRWLRDSPNNTQALAALLDGVPLVIGGHNEFDAAIDAAMGKPLNAELRPPPKAVAP